MGALLFLWPRQSVTEREGGEFGALYLAPLGSRCVWPSGPHLPTRSGRSLGRPRRHLSKIICPP